MTAESGKTGCFLVGKYAVDLDSRRVHLGAEPVELSWRNFEALRALIEAGGEPVERTTLIERLWPDVAVDESSLSQCISQLRKALPDGPENGLIHTIARRGYRLGVIPVVMPAVLEKPNRPKPDRRRLLKVGIVVLLMAIATAWIGRRTIRQNRAQSLVREGLQLVRQNQYQKISAGNALFREALQLSPNLAIAHAGLAEGIARSTRDGPGLAKETALKALEIDPGCVDCVAIAGWILMSREWEYGPALKYLAEAARRKPDDQRIRLWNAQILAATAKFPEALREVDAAIQLEPAHAPSVVMRAGILYLAGDYIQAIAEARRALAIQPDIGSAFLWLYRSYGMQRQFEESLAALSSNRRIFTGAALEKEFEQSTRWHETYRTGGIAAFVRAQLEEESSQPIKNMMRYEHATWRMWIGDHSGALDELENIFEVRPYDSMYLAADPAFAPLRGEPRFAAIVAKMAAGRQ